VRPAALLLLAGCATGNPVTWAEFDRFYEHPDDEKLDGVTRPSMGKGYLVLSGCPNEALEPERPVVGVRWHAALAYCEWLTRKTGRLHRLPTEREGERLPAPPEGLWEYCLESASPDAFVPVLRGATRITPPADWPEADPNRPTSTWWYRAGFSQGFRVVSSPDPYDPKVEVTGLAGRELSVRNGTTTERWIRVSGEVRNAGASALPELGLKVYSLDPSGLPHLADGQALSTRRATWGVCWPALPGKPPLRPGETRAFTADLPLPFDDDSAVAPGRFGASVFGAAHLR
jgi:hypothetical protein